MAGGDTVSVLVAVLLFVTTTLLGVIAWVFLDFRKTVTRQVQTNGRHLDSLISQIWVIIWRLDSVESFLDETTAFRPVRAPLPQNRPDDRS